MDRRPHAGQATVTQDFAPARQLAFCARVASALPALRGQAGLRYLVASGAELPGLWSEFRAGEEGYWLGAYFFNLMAVETVFSVWVVGFLLWTWPSPPWQLFQATTVVLMLVVPFAFFPFSKTLFLAFDLWVRPPGEDDFILPHEEVRAAWRKHP